MSPNPYPVFSVSESDKPEQIKGRIRMLIRLYLNRPNWFLADAVAKHIAAILACPRYINDVEQRCQLRQLELHWRGLAWIDDPSLIVKAKVQTASKTPALRLEMVLCQ